MNKQKKAFKAWYKIFIISLIFAISLGCSMVALAKTSNSSSTENLFFYVLNDQKQSVFVKAISIADLHSELAQKYGYFSYYDSLPTECYAEGTGFTLPDLVSYINDITGYEFTYEGQDAMALICTDQTGFDTVWTYEDLYGVERFYFPEMYENYSSGTLVAEPMQPMLLTKSYAGRINQFEDCVRDNDNIVKGCFVDKTDFESSLRLTVPITEQMFNQKETSARENKKWIYGIELRMEQAPQIIADTVADPQIQIDLEGDIATITFTCETEGAVIYHSLYKDNDGGYTSTNAAQYRYQNAQPIQLDLTKIQGSINIKYFAAKEGCLSSQTKTATYPLAAPGFQEAGTSVFAVELGEDVTFTAINSVTTQQWTEWTDAITNIDCSLDTNPVEITKDDVQINNQNRTITIDGNVFYGQSGGSYTFTFVANGYANKSQSRLILPRAPKIEVAQSYAMGEDIKLIFNDLSYQNNATIKIKEADSQEESLIQASSYLNKETPGEITIKKEYYENKNCVIKQKGTYTLTINNSKYLPGSQTIDIIIGDETIWPSEQKEPALTFTLNNTAQSDTFVGDTLTLQAKLTGEEAFLLYSAQYCVEFDEAQFSDISANPIGAGWQAQVVRQNGKAIVTFLYLDIDGTSIGEDGITFGTITLKPLIGGVCDAMVKEAVAGNKKAQPIEDITAKDLRLEVWNDLPADIIFDAQRKTVTVAVDKTILPQQTTGNVTCIAAIYENGRLLSITSLAASAEELKREKLILDTNDKTDFYVKLFLVDDQNAPLVKQSQWNFAS